MPGRQALQDLLAHGFDPDTLDKVLHDLEVDIGLKQCQADFFQSLCDIRLRQNTLATEALENAFKFCRQYVQHQSLYLSENPQKTEG